MMKNTILVALSALLFSGCDKYLDIIPKDKFIPVSIDDYENMLNEQTVVSHGDYFTDLITDDAFLPEGEPGNLFSKHRLNGRRIYTFNKDVFDENTNDFLWTETYKRLFYFNTVINDIMDLEEPDLFRKKSVRAEALFQRALDHLLLVNTYARHYDPSTAASDYGIPLATVADINAKHKRNTVKEVYDLILSDLKEALPDLPTKSTVTKFRANQAGGYALLSRAYLFMGNYDEALKNADEALKQYSTLADMNTYQVTAPGPFPFVPGTPVGWTSVPDAKSHPESIVARSFLRPFGLGQDVCASPELTALFTNDDRRWVLYYADGWPPAPPFNYMTRYGVKIYLRGDFFNNALNTPELYLIRAECNARANEMTKALNDVNTLRKNRLTPTAFEELSPTDFGNDPERVLRFVLEERRRELAFTGMRHIDLKRLNKDNRFKKQIQHTAEGKTYTLEPNSDNYLRQIWPGASKFNPDWPLN